MPIPSFQMTAPLDGTTVSISPPDALTCSSSAFTAYSTGTLATSNGPMSSYPMSNGVVVTPSPHIGSITGIKLLSAQVTTYPPSAEAS